MPGVVAKTLTGYFETTYDQPWPGLVTSLPSSQIPIGGAFNCSAMLVRGRVTPQPAIFSVTGTGGMNVLMPNFAKGENVCAQTGLQPPGAQQEFTVLITNQAVYISFVNPASVTATKVFQKVFAFPAAYPRYARFGTCVVANKLYFSSASKLGVWCLQPVYFLSGSNFVTQITNPGSGYTSAPAVYMSGGGGTPLTGTATVSGGQLTGITWAGSGYFTSAPTVTLIGGLGSGGGGSSTNYNAGAGVPATASVTQTGTGGSSATSGLINGWSSVAVSPDTLTVTFQASGTLTTTGPYMGGGGADVQISPDGTDWYTILTPSGTFGPQTFTLPLPFSVVNISTIAMRIIANAGTGPGSTATYSAEIGPATPYITVTLVGGPAYEGTAQIILPYPSGYTVTEVSAPTGVQYVTVTANGSGYTNPQVIFQGGGGTGASGTVVMSSTDTIVGVMMNTLGTGYTSPPTVVFLDTTGTGATGVAVTQRGTAFIGGDFMSSMAERLLLGNIIGGDGDTTSGLYQIPVVIAGTGYTSAPTVQILGGGGEGATAIATLAGSTVGGVTITDPGSGYTSAPTINLLSNSGTGALAFAILSTPIAASTPTTYPDRVAWSAPDAPAYFDPNYGLAPGGNNQLTEARGLISSLNVVESVAFVGHNGGITEMTPNTTSALLAFSFYPLWSAEEGVLVRYGSMAQFGTTLAFLSDDSAYTMTPNGLSEIGQNIANLLQVNESSTWNNGNFPLQGLYGSIVTIEGEKHYLIAFSTDDVAFQNGNSTRSTNVYDFNMNAGNWHNWTWAGVTMTCPIYQANDSAQYTPSSIAGESNVQIAADSWLLIALTVATGMSAPYGEQATVYEAAPLTRIEQLLPLTSWAIQPSLAYQFRTEAPSIARQQSERRVAIEYENNSYLAGASITPTLILIYTGQEDPTSQTGTVSQQQASTVVLNYINSSFVNGQILTAQADFGTFTGVDTTLGIFGSGDNALVSLVRTTQVAVMMKGELT